MAKLLKALAVLGTVATMGLFSALPTQAGVVTLKYDCLDCDLTPLPTNIFFDEATQSFERFSVRWNAIDFDFTFPNSQPAFVRQWFWDALSGLPVTPTALPDSGPKEVFDIRWFGDTYDSSSNACFVFFIGASGAGPRCVTPPFPSQTVFLANVGGIASGVPAIPEPSTYALMLAGLGAVAFAAKRRRTVDQLTA